MQQPFVGCRRFRRLDGQTDGQKDRRTDRWTCKLIKTHYKTYKNQYKNLLLPGACLLACLPSCLPAALASGLIWLDLLSALASALICVLTTDFAPEWRPRALCGGLAAPRSGFSLSPPLSGRSVLLCPCSVLGLSCVVCPVSVVAVLSAHSVLVLLSVAVVCPSPCNELSCRMS